MKVLWALIFVCFHIPLVCAQTNETESLTITTYYPTPTGVFRSLRINPSTEPSVAEPGMIYYDQISHVMKYYNSTTWVNLTGGGGGSENWAVITRSCPWGSDGTDESLAEGLGWGQQCNATANDCCFLPACPANWTDVSRTVTIAALDSPKSQVDPDGWGSGYEWMNGWDTPFKRPAAVGNVVRTCVKRGATVITFSKPWRSDHNDGDNVNLGWGNQCQAADNYLNCSGPAPGCPADWTKIGTNVVVASVACPRVWDANGEGCYWASPWSSEHPIAGGALVTICEKN